MLVTSVYHNVYKTMLGSYLYINYKYWLCLLTLLYVVVKPSLLIERSQSCAVLLYNLGWKISVPLVHYHSCQNILRGNTSWAWHRLMNMNTNYRISTTEELHHHAPWHQHALSDWGHGALQTPCNDITTASRHIPRHDRLPTHSLLHCPHHHSHRVHTLSIQ